MITTKSGAGTLVLAACLLLLATPRAEAQCGTWSGSDVYETVLSSVESTTGPTLVEVVVYNPSASPATYQLRVERRNTPFQDPGCFTFVSNRFRGLPIQPNSCAGTLAPGEHETTQVLVPNLQDTLLQVEYTGVSAGLVTAKLSENYHVGDPTPGTEVGTYEQYRLRRRSCF